MPRTVLHEFQVERLQILNEAGEVDPELEPDLDEAQLLLLYESMVRAREADQRMLKLQRQGRIGTFGPCTGQEAASCGPALALGAKDWFYGSFRELGARMMLGEPFSQYLLLHNGYEEGNHTPTAPRLLPYAVIVASQIPHAVGIAYAIKYRREEESAVVVFFGDGATSEGDFHEALNFAAVWRAPVVFICQNNQWAISLPRAKQTRSATIAQKAIAYGMPGIQVDGNDALATYAATREALQRAYRGEGPTLIEAETYRLMMHTTADDPTKYRSEEDVARWRARDPLVRFRRYLMAKGILDEELEAELEAAAKKAVNEEVARFESLTDFAPDEPFRHVYGTSHPEIERQHAEFLATQALEVGHG